jgi:hypothetical protein
MYSIVPFCLLVVINFLIVNTLRHSRRNLITTRPNDDTTATSSDASAMKKQTQMTVTVLILTITFVLLTLPGAIVSGFFYVDLYEVEWGQPLIVLLDDITFSYHAFNFVTLYLTNKVFNQEVKSIFWRRREETSQVAPARFSTAAHGFVGQKSKSRAGHAVTVGPMSLSNTVAINAN